MLTISAIAGLLVDAFAPSVGQIVTGTISGVTASYLTRKIPENKRSDPTALAQHLIDANLITEPEFCKHLIIAFELQEEDLPDPPVKRWLPARSVLGSGQILIGTQAGDTNPIMPVRSQLAFTGRHKINPYKAHASTAITFNLKLARMYIEFSGASIHAVNADDVVLDQNTDKMPTTLASEAVPPMPDPNPGEPKTGNFGLRIEPKGKVLDGNPFDAANLTVDHKILDIEWDGYSEDVRVSGELQFTIDDLEIKDVSKDLQKENKRAPDKVKARLAEIIIKSELRSDPLKGDFRSMRHMLPENTDGDEGER